MSKSVLYNGTKLSKTEIAFEKIIFLGHSDRDGYLEPDQRNLSKSTRS